MSGGMTSAQVWAEQQQRGMLNQCAVEKEPTLGTMLERAMNRTEMLGEALGQLREHLSPVLTGGEPPSAKEASPAVDGRESPAMRMANELINRLDGLHRTVNEIQRRAAI